MSTLAPRCVKSDGRFCGRYPCPHVFNDGNRIIPKHDVYHNGNRTPNLARRPSDDVQYQLNDRVAAQYGGVLMKGMDRTLVVSNECCGPFGVGPTKNSRAVGRQALFLRPSGFGRPWTCTRQFPRGPRKVTLRLAVVSG